MLHSQKEAFARAIELKGEDDDPADAVTKALEDFQKTVDERLKKVEEKTASIETKAKDDTDKKAADKIEDRLAKLEAKANRPAGSKDTKSGEDDIETKALNSFLRTGQVDPEVKTLTIGTSSAGGYVVAPEYSANIIKKLTELSPMRSLASVMGIGTGKVYIPTLTSDASGGWVTETGSRSSAQPAFGQVEINVFEHAVVIPASRQLLEDSMIDLSAFLAERIAVKFAQAEATAFVTGSGSGQPTGFLKTPSDYTQVEAKQDGTDIIKKLIELFYQVPGAYAARGTWAMNRRTMGIIRAAADTATKGTLWSDSLANGTPPMFLGRPVAEFPDMVNLASGDSPEGDTYPVAFGDFASAYQIVDRIGLEIMRDDFTGADTGVVKFRARRRVGGKPVLTEALQLLKGPAPA